MENSDIQKIWGHIKALRPHLSVDRLPRLTKEIARAWASNLEGYSVDEVIQAADRQLAKGSFWPDLSEIVAELPPLPPSRTHLIPGAQANGKGHKADLWIERCHELFWDLKQKRREVGAPATLDDGRAAGMSCKEVWNLWESMGLNIPDNDPELLAMSNARR